MTTHTFAHSQHRLCYTTEGDPANPPLVMIHGWFSHRGVWHQTLAAMKDRHFCVAIDLLGFGDSDKPKDGDYSIEAQGRRVLALADSLGIDQFTVIGHSMGGQTALCIAAMLAPNRVTKVVSVSGVVAGKLTPGVTRRVVPLVALMYRLPVVATIARVMIHNPWYAKKVGFWPWFYDMDALPFDAWELDRRMAFQSGITIPAYKAGQAITSLDLTPHLPKVTAPTLAIFGAQDATVPVSDGHLVDAHVPNSRLVLIDKCGHFPHYEHPEVYLQALESFLAQ